MSPFEEAPHNWSETSKFSLRIRARSKSGKRYVSNDFCRESIRIHFGWQHDLIKLPYQVRETLLTKNILDASSTPELILETTYMIWKGQHCLDIAPGQHRIEDNIFYDTGEKVIVPSDILWNGSGEERWSTLYTIHHVNVQDSINSASPLLPYQ